MQSSGARDGRRQHAPGVARQRDDERRHATALERRDFGRDGTRRGGICAGQRASLHRGGHLAQVHSRARIHYTCGDERHERALVRPTHHAASLRKRHEPEVAGQPRTRGHAHVAQVVRAADVRPAGVEISLRR